MADGMFTNTRPRPKVAGFYRVRHWQRQAGRATLNASKGIQECQPSRSVNLSGRTAWVWVLRNDPGRSIGGLF